MGVSHTPMITYSVHYQCPDAEHPSASSLKNDDFPTLAISHPVNTILRYVRPGHFHDSNSAEVCVLLPVSDRTRILMTGGSMSGISLLLNPLLCRWGPFRRPFVEAHLALEAPRVEGLQAICNIEVHRCEDQTHRWMNQNQVQFCLVGNISRPFFHQDIVCKEWTLYLRLNSSMNKKFIF